MVLKGCLGMFVLNNQEIQQKLGKQKIVLLTRLHNQDDTEEIGQIINLDRSDLTNEYRLR